MPSHWWKAERKFTISILKRASQVVLVVKNPPANAGDVREAGLGWEDPLEEGMATPSRLLA